MAKRKDHSSFWKNVVALPDGCWKWDAGKQSSGYGVFWVAGDPVLAHRWAYEASVGTIPEGLCIDHLCRNRACVRPSHLEPVTMRENILRGKGATAINARKTHCPQDHPYSGENLWFKKSKGRRDQRACRQCDRDSSKRYQAKLRELGRTLLEPAES